MVVVVGGVRSLSKCRFLAVLQLDAPSLKLLTSFFSVTVRVIKQLRVLAVGVGEIWFSARTKNVILVVKLVQQSIFITLVFALLF